MNEPRAGEFWRRAWWLRLWRALFPSREPPNEGELSRWAARAEAASARSSFITLVITIAGLAGAIYTLNLTRVQVAALFESIKPDVEFVEATAIMCDKPGSNRYSFRVMNLGDGNARQVAVVFSVRFDGEEQFDRLQAEYRLTGASDLRPGEDYTILEEGISAWLNRELVSMKPDVFDPPQKIRGLIVSSMFVDRVGNRYSRVKRKDVKFLPCQVAGDKQ